MTTTLTPLTTDTDSPNPDAPPAWRPRLSGRCACCGESETRSLFAMGHDARFRGFLQRALAAGDWTNRVDWFEAPGCAVRVTVVDALAHIADLIDRNWTDKVVAGASRLARKPLVAPSLPRTVAGSSPAPAPASPAPVPTTVFNPVDQAEARIDRLMAALARPLVGQWGWWTNPVGDRFPARVHRTHPDPEIAPSAWRVDLKMVDGIVVEFQRPGSWSRDESAAEAV